MECTAFILLPTVDWLNAEYPSRILVLILRCLFAHTRFESLPRAVASCQYVWRVPGRVKGL